MRIAQIVPALPPPEEGVGTYALALGAALSDQAGIASRYLAAGALPERSVGALAAALAGERIVLLHYANYGYQRRGCPSWLIAALARWKREENGRRLVTVFHEIHASGPPWRSSFWLRSRQRQLAARLLRLSDAAVTSLELYAARLRRWSPEARIAVSPVFSPVGEPAAVPRLATRPRRLILFGGPGTRRRAYREWTEELASACAALGIEEVCDVGPPVRSLPTTIDGAPVRPCGSLPAEAVSTLMLRSLAGFLAYPPDFLPKSTIFAAYCAHGLLPVCASRRHGRAEGASAAFPFWTPGDGITSELEGLGAQAHRWYSEHSLAKQVELFGRLLEDGRDG